MISEHNQERASGKRLTVLFWLTLVFTASFQVVSTCYQMQFLDTVVLPEDSWQLLVDYSERQVFAHIVTLLSLDVVYPIIYTSFFIVALRQFYPDKPRLVYLAWGGFLADIAEGAVQVMILFGSSHLLELKAVVTSAKFFCFFTLLLMAAFGWVRKIRVKP